MKEFVEAGAVAAVLVLFGGSSAEPEVSVPVQIPRDEGFIPHQRITVPPIQESVDQFLPDFGSPSYL